MRHARTFGSLAVAAIVSLAFTSAASATYFTSPQETEYTGAIEAQAEGHVVLDTPLAKIECASMIEAQIESHEVGVTATLGVGLLTFGHPIGVCTNDWHVTVVSYGSLAVHGTAYPDGGLYSNGLTIEITRFGVKCTYVTSNTKIGTVTGGDPATLDISGVLPVHTGSSFLCGSGAATWTGSYEVTTPGSLYVHFDA